MYHIVNGSYFSQDLRDGQQLASILDMKPIQVGVRVDGCSRKYTISAYALILIIQSDRFVCFDLAQLGRNKGLVKQKRVCCWLIRWPSGPGTSWLMVCLANKLDERDYNSNRWSWPKIAFNHLLALPINQLISDRFGQNGHVDLIHGRGLTKMKRLLEKWKPKTSDS